MTHSFKGPVVLLILDGWGVAPESKSNPVTSTKLPGFDKLFKQSQHSRLWAHGEYVGLPKDQDGNSEAGHLNLGAGRVVKQDSVIISESIKDGTFFKNGAFAEAIQHVKRNNSAIHLIGLLSDGQSAHSTPGHLNALLKLMHQEKLEKVYVHLFTDGRDSLPQSGRDLFKDFEKQLYPGQKVATIMGRFYGMDRKKEWDRTRLAYDAIVSGEGIKINDPIQAFDTAYSNDRTDEYIKPHVIVENNECFGKVNNNDSIISFNHRSDRARQLAKFFVQKDFEKMNPGASKPVVETKNVRFVAMSDFGPDLGDIITAYPSKDVVNTLPMMLQTKRQLYIAETEKYAHITYFFNGGYANSVANEHRVMIQSPNVRKYDEKPGMATTAIMKHIFSSLQQDKYDFIASNIACLDMVAHTGNFLAAQKSLEIVDTEIGNILELITRKKGILIVTSDHGNIEEMGNFSTDQIDTEHSKNQVPFVITGHDVRLTGLRTDGILGDVAPTILELFNIHKPKEMDGLSLFKIGDKK